MSRILHFADLHLDPSTRDNTEHAVEQLIEAAQREKPDLIVNAGDLSMKRGLIAPWVSLALRRLHVELARIAPVIVVSGNHDMGAAGDVGTVLGSLDLAEASDRIHLVERPRIIHVAGLAVACVPYPSRSWLLAGRPDLSAKEVNAALSDELRRVVMGLGAEIEPGERAILVYHGSIDGARTDTEQAMSTEIDVVLLEGEIPACFEAVLCGHIHKHQRIGRAVYAGSPCPLNFGETKSDHGYCLWHRGEDWVDEEDGECRGGWSASFEILPPKHPLATVDLRGTDWLRDIEYVEIPGSGARVRVLVTDGNVLAPVREEDVRKWFMQAGAHSVKVIIERPAELRVSGPEVKAEAAMGVLLDLYAARHPEIDPATLEGLKIIAEEVDNTLPPEARLAQSVGGYRLHRLAWDNWKSYGKGNEIDLDRLGRLIVIEGDNATGKSNAAEVEAFVLYGKFVRGRQSLAEAVRNGESEALIVAEFDAAGDRWKVERRIKVNGKGAGSQSLDLFRKDGEDWSPASLGSSRETQERIEALVGPLDLYLATRFASQGDIDRLLDLSPADMKDTLQKALATSVFEDREKIGRALLNVAERALAEHEASLTGWREMAGKADEIRAEAEAAEAARAQAERQAEVAIGDLREAEDAVHADGEALREAEALLKDHCVAEKAVASAAVAIEGTEAGIVECERLIRDLGDIEKALADLKEKRQQKVEEEHLLKLSRDSEAAAAAAEQRLQLVTRELEALEEKARDALARHEDATTDRKARIESDLFSARQSADLIGRVPFQEKCAEAACAFVLRAVEARKQIPDLEARLAAVPAEHEKRRDAIIAEYQQKAAPIRRRYEEADREAQQLRSEAETHAHGDVDFKRLAQEIAFLEAGGWEQKSRKAAEANGRLEALRTALAAQRSDLHGARERLVELGQRPDAGMLRAELEKSQRLAEAAKAASATAADLLARSERAVGIAEGKLEQCMAAEARLAGSERMGSELTRRRDLCRLYVQAVGRDGLPFLMLERALPALEAHANHFLCEDDPSGLRVEIGGLRDLKSGESRNEVTIRYRNGFGLHSVAAASGFERSVIGVALRAALSQVQAEASGVSVEHWISDECSGVCDQSNLLVMQGVFRRIAERFGRVLYISHQQEIQQIADTRLRVEVTGDGSRIAA